MFRVLIKKKLLVIFLFYFSCLNIYAGNSNVKLLKTDEASENLIDGKSQDKKDSNGVDGVDGNDQDDNHNEKKENEDSNKLGGGASSKEFINEGETVVKRKSIVDKDGDISYTIFSSTDEKKRKHFYLHFPCGDISCYYREDQARALLFNVNNDNQRIELNLSVDNADRILIIQLNNQNTQLSSVNIRLDLANFLDIPDGEDFSVSIEPYLLDLIDHVFSNDDIILALRNMMSSNANSRVQSFWGTNRLFNLISRFCRYNFVACPYALLNTTYGGSENIIDNNIPVTLVRSGTYTYSTIDANSTVPFLGREETDRNEEETDEAKSEQVLTLEIQEEKESERGDELDQLESDTEETKKKEDGIAKLKAEKKDSEREESERGDELDQLESDTEETKKKEDRIAKLKAEKKDSEREESERGDELDQLESDTEETKKKEDRIAKLKAEKKDSEREESERGDELDQLESDAEETKKKDEMGEVEEVIISNRNETIRQLPSEETDTGVIVELPSEESLISMGGALLVSE